MEKDYPALNAQSTNYRIILRFLVASGINEFLKARKLLPLDLMASPEDTTGGESAIIFLKAIADECNRMDKRILSLSEALVDSNILLAKERRKNIPFFKKIKELVWKTS